MLTFLRGATLAWQPPSLDDLFTEKNQEFTLAKNIMFIHIYPHNLIVMSNGI